MKTTMNIPEELIREAMAVSSHRTKTEAVIAALREYVRMKTLEQILDLEGALQLDDTWEKARHGR